MKIEILHPPNQVQIAIELIETIKKKNKFTYDLRILLDYQMEDAGQYDPKNPTDLVINPWVCEALCTKKKNSDDEFSFTYLQDDTIFGTILHEFSHFLSMTYFVDFQKNFLEVFLF